MNTISLNNLWSYLQGLTLTTSNKKWLAEHLYEDIRKEERVEHPIKELAPSAMLTEEELPDIVRSLSGVISSVDDDDLNGRRAYYEYLAQKHA